MTTTGLLQRNLPRHDEPVVRAQRNRLVCSFSPLPLVEFPVLMEVVQPLFQSAGFAPHILVRRYPDVVRFDEETINYNGPCHGFALAWPLYVEGRSRESLEQGIDGFIHLCGRAAEAIDERIRPRGWFGIRRPSGEVRQPVMPGFDKTRDQACNLAWRLASFLKNLPRYQRAVEVAVVNVEVEPEELADFIDFMGFPPDQLKPGFWFDPETNAHLRLFRNQVSFGLPCVPRTPTPEIIFENLHDAARRFSMEFGGEERVQDGADRVIAGWTTLLQHLGFKPGDAEVRELFPFDPLA